MCSPSKTPLPNKAEKVAKSLVVDASRIWPWHFPFWAEASPLLCFAEERGLRQTEQHDLFPGERTDIVMQAHHLDARDLLNQGFHQRPCGLDQVGPHLLEQIPPL